MQVLVTGGAGFIGSHVVPYLLDRGHAVRVLDDLSSGRREHVPAGVDFREGSITDPDDVRAAVDRVQTVVHLAAIASVTQSIEAPSDTHAVNLAGTIGLAEAASAAGVTKLVYASSAAVYGAIEREVHREDDQPAPITPYAIDKLTGEHYLRFFARQHGLDVRALRFFNVYGPRQLPSSPYAGVIARFATALLHDEPVTIFGDGEQTRDFIAVDDVATIVTRHAEQAVAPGQAQVMNVCNSTRTSLRDLIEQLSLATSRAPVVRYEPARDGDIRHSRGSDERLTAWFAERPRTGLAEGLARVLDWMRAAEVASDRDPSGASPRGPRIPRSPRGPRIPR